MSAKYNSVDSDSFEPSRDSWGSVDSRDSFDSDDYYKLGQKVKIRGSDGKWTTGTVIERIDDASGGSSSTSSGTSTGKASKAGPLTPAQKSSSGATASGAKPRLSRYKVRYEDTATGKTKAKTVGWKNVKKSGSGDFTALYVVLSLTAVVGVGLIMYAWGAGVWCFRSSAEAGLYSNLNPGLGPMGGDIGSSTPYRPPVMPVSMDVQPFVQD